MSDLEPRAASDRSQQIPPAAPVVLVWDLPTRIFHWALVVLVVVNTATGKIGGNFQMEVHAMSGYAILALVLFRVAWGFVGGCHARFGAFLCAPGTVREYARGLFGNRRVRFLGHNPLGGWSVIAMLLVLLIQAGTGLCANDDILTEGPLARKVGKETSDFLTYIHYLSSNVLFVLIGLHVAAVVFYLAKGENLVGPMFSGRKTVDPTAAVRQAQGKPEASLWLAAIVIAAAAAGVWAIVRL